jgi:hypothetical protein
MTDNNTAKQLEVDDPVYQINCALEALKDPGEAELYKARCHLHRALITLENEPRYKDSLS